MNKTVLFSGRFDRPHCGHVATIQRLGSMFTKVLIVILDYPGQRYPVEYRRKVLETVLQQSYGHYNVVVNADSFETISAAAVRQFEFDVYASGNPKCVQHMMELGYDVYATRRSWDYEASKEP